MPLTHGSIDEPCEVYECEASYSCDAHYVMDGSSVISCEAAGEWSDEPPVCLGECTNSVK